MRALGGLAALFFALTLASALSGCGGGGSTAGNPLLPTEDTSSSGAAAAAAGGALSGSSVVGTMASGERPMKSAPFSVAAFFGKISSALASDFCPTTLTPSGSGCESSGSSLWLLFPGCSYAGSKVTLSGILEIISTKTAKCGAFPNPGINGNLIRQYVETVGGTAPGKIEITSVYGTVAVIDNETANLGNFDGDTIAPIANGGYGSQVDFGAQGQRTGATIGQRLQTNSDVDQSIAGSLAVTETAGASSRVITGQLTVYHNLLKVIGTSTFTDVVHSDGCCLPVSGVIRTAFTQGTSVSPTASGAKMVGAAETLTLTGCGTGTLQSYDGTTSSVTLSRCF